MTPQELEQWIKANSEHGDSPHVYIDVEKLRELFKGRRLVQAGDRPVFNADDFKAISNAWYRQAQTGHAPERERYLCQQAFDLGVRKSASIEPLQPASVDEVVLPRDPVALLTPEMKAEHIGEYLMDIQVNCEECDREGCDACNHQGRVTWSPAIPWATCKQIFKAMYTTAVKAAEVKP